MNCIRFSLAMAASLFMAAQGMAQDAAPALDPHNPRPVEVSYKICNTDRAFGATLAGEIAERKVTHELLAEIEKQEREKRGDLA